MPLVLIGLASFCVLLALLAVRVPIAVAMLAVGAGGYIVIDGAPSLLAFLKTAPFETFSSYSFSVIPLFLLMGNLAAVSGLAARLFRGASALVGRLPGGLAMAAIVACAAFGTICGSSLATAATMGKIALPEMRRYGYAGSLSTGALAAGGTLGILVPPSVPLVIYAVLTEQNIAKLFLAAFTPALLAILGFGVAILFTVWRRPETAPPAPALATSERWRDIAATWPVGAIFIAVFVGMNGDFFVGRSLFTPTEGAAVGAAATAVAAFAIGGIGRHGLIEALLQTAEQTGFIFLILLGAELYNAFLARTAMPDLAAQWVSGLGLPAVMVIAAIVVLYILLGCLMDSLSMIMLTIPVFFPVVMGLDFGMSQEATAIWFGILALVVVELGLIHPPVGLNVYVIQSIAGDVPMLETVKGVLPFIVVEFVRVALLIAFPAITLWIIR